MLLTVLCIMIGTAYGGNITDPDKNQLLIFKEKHPNPIGIITTGNGAPVEYYDTKTLNKRLLYNEFFLETITHLSRERIPERVVHAKGGGAFGYFEVEQDLSDICEAKVFSEVGKRTPIAIRFSSTFPNSGGTDTTREARGYAIKFYTEDGNFDIVGLSSPMFGMKDPIKFPNFVHAMKRNPATHLEDANMMWDFLTSQPEALFVFLYLFGDRGIPDGYRHMPGFGIHTFQVVNQKGQTHFVRFHFIPDAGIRNLTTEEARNIQSNDTDYAIRDLYKAIGDGNFPSWTLYVQVLSPHDVLNAGFDVFEVTRVLPVNKYPLRRVGRCVLNRNPENYFAEIEQLAFCPSNLVKGIPGAPDKIFEARLFSYRDAQYYRLGANFFKIPVNCPLRKTYTYNRDGSPVKDNEKGGPNYSPNSFNGAVAYKAKNRVEVVDIRQPEAYNFDQARELYENEMSSGEKGRAVENIVSTLSLAAKFLQQRAVQWYTLIHPDLGSRVQKALQENSAM